MAPLLRFCVRHPWVVLALTLAVTAGLGAFIPEVPLRLDARSLLPRDEPDLAASDRVAARFELHDTVVVGLVNSERGLYTPQSLTRLARLSARLAQLEGILPGSVQGLPTLTRMKTAGGMLDLAPVLGPGPIRSLEEAEQLRQDVRALGLDDGILVSADGHAAALYASVRPEADRYALFEQVSALAREETAQGDTVHVGGNALAQAGLGRVAAVDLLRLMPLVIGALLLLLVLAYRHPVPALVSLTEVGLSLVWTAGLMGLTQHPVFITTLIFPVVLMAVGVSDDVYALDSFLRAWRGGERSLEEAVLAGFGAVARPIALSMATTVVGLLSLLASSLEPLRTFGLFGAISLAASSLFTFTLVPALLALASRRLRGAEPSRSLAGGRGGWSRALGGLGTYRPRRVLGVTAVASAGAAVLALGLQVNDSWVGNLPAGSLLSRDDAVLNRYFAGTTALELEWETQRADGFTDPEAFAALDRATSALAGSAHVGAVRGVHTDLLRALATLLGESLDAYRGALQSGQRQLTPADLQQALLLLETGSALRLREWLEAGARRARTTVFIREASSAKIDAVLRATESALPPDTPAPLRATPFGDGWISHLSVRLLVSGQVRSILLAGLANLLLLLAVFRSLRLALVASLPTFLGVLAVFAVLSALEIPLGIASSMFAAIGLGIGMDYSIHLVAQYQAARPEAPSREAAMMRTLSEAGPAILTSMVAVSGAMAVLLLSESPPNRLLGLLVCLSLAVSAALCLLLVPALTLTLERPR